jgi:hypothetical protein
MRDENEAPGGVPTMVLTCEIPEIAVEIWLPTGEGAAIVFPKGFEAIGNWLAHSIWATRRS